MKAITLTQPWAWSILSAGKRIENRSRSDGRMPDICRHRGPLLLHAAKGMRVADYIAACAFMVKHGLARAKDSPSIDEALPVIPPRLQDVGDEMLPRGVIVGRCRAVGHMSPAHGTLPCSNSDIVLTEDDLRWWMGGYALILADVEPTKWVPCRGMLGLWTPKPDVLAQLEADHG